MNNPVRDKLRAGGVPMGVMAFDFFTPGLAPALAAAGAEFILLDMEHSGAGIDTMKAQAAFARGAGLVPMVRVPGIHYHLIAPVLDAGAMGIMAPMVETPEQAEKLSKWCRYRPEGVRGLELRVARGVADDPHLRALVERLLDLGRQRDVLDEEHRDLEAERLELRADARADLVGSTFTLHAETRLERRQAVGVAAPEIAAGDARIEMFGVTGVLLPVSGYAKFNFILTGSTSQSGGGGPVTVEALATARLEVNETRSLQCLGTTCPPIEVRYDATGVLWMGAGPGRVQRGDCVAVVMRDYDARLAAAA